jgi:hypothetical protein
MVTCIFILCIAGKEKETKGFLGKRDQWELHEEFGDKGELGK